MIARAVESLAHASNGWLRVGPLFGVCLAAATAWSTITDALSVTDPTGGWSGGFAFAAPWAVLLAVCRDAYGKREDEIRQAIAERRGYENLVDRGMLRPVQTDECGQLWRFSFRNGEQLVLLEVENATLEPDGSRKRYFLRVPPDRGTAREAVAWTFDIAPDGYQPLVET